MGFSTTRETSRAQRVSAALTSSPLCDATAPMLGEQGKCQVTTYWQYITPQAYECRVKELDMLMLAKIMLHVTLNQEDCLLFAGFRHHAAFPRGPLLATDLPLTQNSATISKILV